MDDAKTFRRVGCNLNTKARILGRGCQLQVGIVGILEEFDSKKIATGIVDGLLKKIRSCKSMAARSGSIKSNEMNAALRKMRQGR